MPKSKAVSSYPLVYHDMFDQAVINGGFTIEGIPPGDEAKLRFDIYGFRKACINEDLPDAKLWSSFSISIKPGQLILTPPDETAFANLIELNIAKQKARKRQEDREQRKAAEAQQQRKEEAMDLSNLDVYTTPESQDSHDFAADVLANMGYKSPNTKED